MKHKQLKQKLLRLTAGTLIASMSVSPCVSMAASGPGVEYMLMELAEDDSTAAFEKMRSDWKNLLTGGEMDVSDPLVKNYITNIDIVAEENWNALIKLGDAAKDTRTHLFEEQPLVKKGKEGSSQITMTFNRIKTIVLAYETTGSKFYKNPEVRKEMIAALDLMIRDHYSVYYACKGTGTSLGSGNNSFGNWFDWRIGTPRNLCEILLMMHDELTAEQIARYAEPILENNKKVDATGANRTWIANTFVQCGVILGDASLIEAGREGLKAVLKYVDVADGFHADGSFIQHTNYAYTGGYGKALICTIAPMMYVLHDTEYAIEYDDGREQILYDMIFEAYEPLIYGGRFMDMAREREISRLANQDSMPGRQVIRAIILLIDVLPDEQKERAERMVKEWISDDEVLAQVCLDPTTGYTEYYVPAGMIPKAIELAASGIEPRGSLVKHKRYGAMDRVVHLRDEFGFTISMSSNRIYNTEGTNNEGLRLWNIGDGLTYIYNDDKTWYSDHYWATVDHHRLPGTTVNRVENRGPKIGYDTPNPYKFAGGTDLGEYGIAGMELQGVGITDKKRDGAHSKKSWFMFDDEIVALGSDIRSTLADSKVETIVENRKIQPDMSNPLIVDGALQERSSDGSSDDFNGLHEGTTWIHLAGSTGQSDVGYYFPEGADITGVREQREGSWSLVNTYEKHYDTEPRQNSFVTFWFDHGEKPDKETYAYVLLPGMSEDETGAYAEEPDIEVLRQDETIHAVRENTLGITGINFFEPGRFGAFIADVPQSVMHQEQEDGTLKISFADPTQTQTALSLTAALPILEVVEKSEEVEVSDVDGDTVFTVVTDESPEGMAGKSFFVTVRLAEEDNLFETIEAGMVPEHWTVTSGSAVVVEEESQNHALKIEGPAEASVNLDASSEENGSIIGFKLRCNDGSGTIRLEDTDGNTIEVPYSTNADDISDGTGIVLESGVWHTIRIKVNEDNDCYYLMLDDKLISGALEYQGSMPVKYTILADTDSNVYLDNLLIREASTEAPTRPERLTYTEYGDTYVKLKWDASESENPLHYMIYVNGEELEEHITENQFEITGLTPEETYVFEVQAADDDDNYSELSAQLEVTLIEKQNDSYIINFDEYESGTASQHRWTYAGTDTKGNIEILEVPLAKDPAEEDLITDIEYWASLTASPSNAVMEASEEDGETQTATVSNASKATASDAEKDEDVSVLKAELLKASPSNAAADGSDKVKTATPSNIDKALYVYSGTAKSGVDKKAAYTFDPQTTEQTYRLKLYFDTCTKYTNVTLFGSNDEQAITMMVSSNGNIGYRAGDAPSTTVNLLDEVIEDEWIDMSITADPETQLFSISANGTEKTNLPFRSAAKNITRLSLAAPGNAKGGFYIDDIILPANNESQFWTLKALEEDFSDGLTVPYGTDFYDLRLPESAEVTAIAPDGEEVGMDIRINWEMGDYDGQKSGTYTLKGTLAYPANCVNEIADKKIRIKVEVEREIKFYTVTLSQTNGGTISADTETAEEGTDVTVTAEPDDGYCLAGWLVNGEQKSASGSSYSFSLEEDVNVSAIFEAEDVEPEGSYYRVTIADDIPGGSISVNTSFAKENSIITLTIVPDEGYELRTLKVNGQIVELGDDLTYTFLLDGNTTVSAVFKQTKSDSSNAGTDNSGSSGSSSSGSSSSGSSSSGSSGSGSGGSGSRSSGTSDAVSGTWKLDQENHDWYFVRSDGTLATGWAHLKWNNVYDWYYFSETGRMLTGWITSDGHTYYLQETADGFRGRMLVGWQLIGGKWYYFNQISDGTKGAMLTNTVTPDGYYVGEDGVWIP